MILRKIIVFTVNLDVCSRAHV